MRKGKKKVRQLRGSGKAVTKYSPPSLVRYGRLKSLTAAATGSLSDGMNQ